MCFLREHVFFWDWPCQMSLIHLLYYHPLMVGFSFAWHRYLKIHLCTAFATIAFITVIATIRVIIIAAVKMLDPDFKIFSSLGLFGCFHLRHRFVQRSSWSRLIFVHQLLKLDRSYFGLISFPVGSFNLICYFEIIGLMRIIGSILLNLKNYLMASSLDFRQLFLPPFDFTAELIPIDFGLWANRCHHRLAFHFRKILGMHTAIC